MSDLAETLRRLADEADEDWNTPGHADWRLTAASRLIGLSSTLARLLADEHDALLRAGKELHDAGTMLARERQAGQAEHFANSSKEVLAVLAATETALRAMERWTIQLGEAEE